MDCILGLRFEAFPGRTPGARESPNVGNHLAEANRSAKSSPAGSASQRPSTTPRTPVRPAAPTVFLLHRRARKLGGAGAVRARFVTQCARETVQTHAALHPGGAARI